MHPFASYVLRNYYKATGWDEDNLFTNLTRSSDAILDFTVPKGLHLSISKSPNSLFKTTYSMNAMPSLNGSVGYIFTSCDLNVHSSSNVRFKDLIQRFKVYGQPKRPQGRDEEWLGGERVDKRDYLMYGRLYLPTGRLDALYTTRLAPTLQAVVAAISDPPSNRHGQGKNGDPSNVVVYLQHDVGKWCTEYTYSAEDSMWGLKFLHNFGRLGQHPPPEDSVNTGRAPKRVDEEEPVEGGLKGLVSAGAEFYFSAKERSAGVSTGIRFTTLPDATPPSAQIPSGSSQSPSPSKYTPSQPPTTITALFNPMLGHLSGAYSARVSRDLALSSRFDFNVYSFESEWTMGAEWWLRKPSIEDTSDDSLFDISSTIDVLSSTSEDRAAYATSPSRDGAGTLQGVVKARASTSSDVSLMWEGRIRNMLVSLGVVTDFSNRSKPIRGIGLELSYFSSEE